MEIADDDFKSLCKLQASVQMAVSALNTGADLESSIINGMSFADRLREAGKETKPIALKYENELDSSQEIG